MRAAIIALLASATQAGVETFGGVCPENVPVQQDFDLNKYIGRWYEYQRDSFNIWELGAECSTATYTKRLDNVINVENRGLFPVIGYAPVEGTAACTRMENVANCDVAFGPFQSSVIEQWEDDATVSRDDDWWAYAGQVL